MRKKEQNIPVSLNNITVADKDGYELLVADKKIGTIVTEEPNRFSAQSVPDNTTKHFKNLDDAINDLLMSYNLHQH